MQPFEGEPLGYDDDDAKDDDKTIRWQINPGACVSCVSTRISNARGPPHPLSVARAARAG